MHAVKCSNDMQNKFQYDQRHNNASNLLTFEEEKWWCSTISDCTAHNLKMYINLQKDAVCPFHITSTNCMLNFPLQHFLYNQHPTRQLSYKTLPRTVLHTQNMKTNFHINWKLVKCILLVKPSNPTREISKFHISAIPSKNHLEWKTCPYN